MGGARSGSGGALCREGINASTTSRALTSRQIGDEDVERVIVKPLEEKARRRNVLVHALDGGRDGDEPDRDQPDLVCLRAEATPGRALQALTDPQFVDKVRDIVGLYLNPPEAAVVLCVDEKSQIQGLAVPPTHLVNS